MEGDGGRSLRDGGAQLRQRDVSFDPREPQSSEDDSKERKKLRRKYRELIDTVLNNKEDILKPSSTKLTEVLKEANKLFKDVQQVREAALDAQLLVVTTEMAKEKATQLSSANEFDPNVFVEHLLSLMGLNRLEGGEDRQVVDGYLPHNAWQRLAWKTESYFRAAPSFHFLNGAFPAELPPPKVKMERERKTPCKAVNRIMPTQLKKSEGSLQTEKEVERILGYLLGYYREDPTSPISYFEFVIDPNSFSRTIENIFHTSFLIRDGFARIYSDHSNLPCIEPTVEKNKDDGDTSKCKQCIISLSPKMWKELIDAFGIRDTMIQPPNTQN